MRRGRAQNAHSERAMRAALEVKARAAWRLALRRAESRKREELVASVVEEVGGAPLSFVFEDLRARQARRDEQALIFGPSGRDEPVLSSFGASDNRIGIEVAALVVEDGIVLETVRKVARKADADDDEAEKRAREKRAKVSGMNRKERRAAAQKEDKQAAVRAIVQARVEARKRAVEAKKRAEAAVFEARVADRKARAAEREARVAVARLEREEARDEAAWVEVERQVKRRGSKRRRSVRRNGAAVAFVKEAAVAEGEAASAEEEAAIAAEAAALAAKRAKKEKKRRLARTQRRARRRDKAALDAESDAEFDAELDAACAANAAEVAMAAAARAARVVEVAVDALDCGAVANVDAVLLDHRAPERRVAVAHELDRLHRGAW